MKTIHGYAAIWGAISTPLGGFVEVIRRGAFAKSIKTGDARAFFNHNADLLLGRKSAGTLSLKEDAKGLYVEITPPDASYARDLIRSIERGDVTGFSFGFHVVRDSWLRAGPDGFPLRELLEVNLIEISPCTLPAYPQTEASVRGAAEATVPEAAGLIIPAAVVGIVPREEFAIRRRKLRLLQLVA